MPVGPSKAPVGRGCGQNPTLFCVCCRYEGPLERERPVSRLDGRIRLGSDCHRLWVQSWDVRQEEGKSFLHGVQRADSVGRGAVGGVVLSRLDLWGSPDKCCSVGVETARVLLLG